MEPEDFIREILVKQLRAAYVVVGPDFHFGHNRKGNPELLRQAGTQYGFEVEILSKETREERPISSTWIREVLQEGNIEKVNELLGYPGILCWEKWYMEDSWGVPGDFRRSIRCRKTENFFHPLVSMHRKLLSKVKRLWNSNVGVKSTVEVPFAGVETYLFDCDEDLYGEEARVEFYHFVRPECKFDSVEELKAQIQRDAGSGKRYFEKRGLHY